MKKVLGQLCSAAFTLVVILGVFIAYGSINNRFYRVILIEGNSMSPTLWAGDLIVVTRPTKDLSLNSIVVMSVDGKLVTHRIVGFDDTGRPVTKGDANIVVDDFSNNDVRVAGIYRFRFPRLGFPLLFLSELRQNS